MSPTSDDFRESKITVCNGNRTDWSPIRFVIIKSDNKIGRTHSDLFITTMILDELDDTTSLITNE